jgi:hypothetical protein
MMLPPAATVSRLTSSDVDTVFRSAFSSSRESASMPQKYSFDARLIPALSESAFPPLALSITVRRGRFFDR